MAPAASEPGPANAVGEAGSDAGSRPRALGSGGPTVTWLGHATAVAELGPARVVFDPLLRSRARAAGKVDAVLITHSHVDHLNRWSLKAIDRDTHLVVPMGRQAYRRRSRVSRGHRADRRRRPPGRALGDHRGADAPRLRPLAQGRHARGAGLRRHRRWRHVAPRGRCRLLRSRRVRRHRQAPCDRRRAAADRRHAAGLVLPLAPRPHRRRDPHRSRLRARHLRAARRARARPDPLGHGAPAVRPARRAAPPAREDRPACAARPPQCACSPTARASGLPAGDVMSQSTPL